MKKTARVLLLAGLATLCGLALPGCLRFKPVVDSTRFFTLAASAPAPDPAPASAPARPLADPAPPGPALGLRLTSFPGYLDNPRFAERKNDHEIHYRHALLWAEPLDRGFLRILGLHLASLLQSQTLYVEEWTRASVGLEVYVDLSRFEPDDRGLVTLESRWRIMRPGQGEILRKGTTRLQKQGPPLSSNPEQTVSSLNAVLGEFGRVLAQAISSLPAAPEQ